MSSPLMAAALLAGAMLFSAGCAAPLTRAGGDAGCLAGRCHGSVVSAPHLHLPVETGNCGVCHRQTAPDHPDGDGIEFARVWQENGVFCFDCHLERDPEPAFVHEPYGAGACGECHENHGSYFRPLVRRDINGLCLYCHRALASRIETCRFTHGPVESETCVVTCHDPHASDVEPFLRSSEEVLCRECHRALSSCPGGEGRCSSCHFPHAANNPQLLRDR